MSFTVLQKLADAGKLDDSLCRMIKAARHIRFPWANLSEVLPTVPDAVRFRRRIKRYWTDRFVLPSPATAVEDGISAVVLCDEEIKPAGLACCRTAIDCRSCISVADGVRSIFVSDPLFQLANKPLEEYYAICWGKIRAVKYQNNAHCNSFSMIELQKVVIVKDNPLKIVFRPQMIPVTAVAEIGCDLVTALEELIYLKDHRPEEFYVQ